MAAYKHATSPESHSTTIQPPISSSTMVNASRRKFVQSPRIASEIVAQLSTKKPAARVLRQHSNKLLSPVPTAARTAGVAHTVTSPQGKYVQESAVTKSINRDSIPRPKSSANAFNSVKSVTHQSL